MMPFLERLTAVVPETIKWPSLRCVGSVTTVPKIGHILNEKFKKESKTSEDNSYIFGR
jgi:hypothetical protein